MNVGNVNESNCCLLSWPYRGPHRVLSLGGSYHALHAGGAIV